MPEQPALVSRPPLYGMTTCGDLFTPRQLVALTTFSDLVQEARERVQRDALAAGLPDDGKPLRDGGTGATAYAEAVAVYLGVRASSKLADYGNIDLCTWEPIEDKSSQHVRAAGDSDGLGLRRGESASAMSAGDFVTASSDGLRRRFERLPCDAWVRRRKQMRRSIADAQPRQGRLHRPALLRQHRLRRPVGLLLRLAAPLAAARLPRPLRHARRAQGRGAGRHALPPRQQGEGGGLLPRRHDAGDAPPRRAGAPGLPGHHLLRLQAVGERRATKARPAPAGRPFSTR